MGDRAACRVCGRDDVKVRRCGVKASSTTIAGFHVDIEEDVWMCGGCERMERERAERAERRKGRYR